ncbi:MAG: sigma-70 family RNA polymerase sigma factor [Opitutaceae bacterium]|nr:sigma-70 family RNA polymerase sigma factor [Opitutaceae bacterium]
MNSPRSVRNRPESTEQAAAKAGKKAEAAIDARLVARFNAGDQSAFSEIIKRYYPRIRALAYQTLRNEADAEEVAQDTFIRAHKGLGAFRGDSSLATWLYCIGLNLARNRYWYFFRRRRQDTCSFDQPVAEGSSTSLAEVIPAGVSNPRLETMTDEFSELIAACMARLDASHREILGMRSMLDLSYEEIADALGINVGTVKSRIARARESLRTQLMQVAPEFGKESVITDFFETPRQLPGMALAIA